MDHLRLRFRCDRGVEEMALKRLRKQDSFHLLHPVLTEALITST